jgi:hypothetical protein
MLVGFGGTAGAVAPATTTTKTYPDGYVLANLSWGQKCLHEGEFCKVGNPEYHAYGFDCPDGRLVDYPTTPTSSATSTTTTTAPPPTSTTSTTTPASRSTNPPITALRPTSRKKPIPRSAQQAVARVRAAPDTNREASPFQRELAWVAQWRGDRWWVLGLFESSWGARFVVDATLMKGNVYAYINYADRPAATWVRTTAKQRWGLRTFYTRFTAAVAISAAEQETGVPVKYTVIDAAAKLASDTARQVAWYFAIYVQDKSGKRLVVVILAFGGGPVEEGTYAGDYDYGFGARPTPQTTVPLNLVDWVRAVAKARHWTPSNLP